jgi:syntaxin 16
MQQSDLAYNFAKERKHEVDGLIHSLQELAVVFRDLSALTVHQGSIFDRIDFNVFEAKQESEKAVENLVKCEE